MKKNLFFRHYLMVGALLLLIASCKKDTVNNNKPLKASDDPNFVSSASASVVATTATTSLFDEHLFSKQAINSTTGLPVAKKILDSVAMPDNINPSYYVFNYVGGGFVIVSADKRVLPILAISDQGAFKKTDNMAPPLVDWLTKVDKNMKLVKKNSQLKADDKTKRLWSGLLPDNKPSSGGGLSVNYTKPGCTDSYTTKTVGPYLATQWGQGYPYNALCPAGNYSYGHVPTGCVATSVAQIMYYWKVPASYAWNLMPLDYTPNGSNELARLMHDIGVATGMSYSDAGSGTSSTGSFALKFLYGYSSASDGDYNPFTVTTNLDAYKPVILYGSPSSGPGHQWVSDGYMQNFVNVCPTADSPGYGYSVLFLHMNWGWNEYGGGNNSNGYYIFDNWTVLNGTQTESFTKGQGMVYNIHP